MGRALLHKPLEPHRPFVHVFPLLLVSAKINPQETWRVGINPCQAHGTVAGGGSWFVQIHPRHWYWCHGSKFFVFTCHNDIIRHVIVQLHIIKNAMLTYAVNCQLLSVFRLQGSQKLLHTAAHQNEQVVVPWPQRPCLRISLVFLHRFPWSSHWQSI